MIQSLVFLKDIDTIFAMYKMLTAVCKPLEKKSSIFEPVLAYSDKETNISSTLEIVYVENKFI